MRASYHHPLPVQDTYQLKGEAAHHLLNVVRVQMFDEILLLNGQGSKVLTQVSAVSKKELTLKALEHEDVDRKYVMDLALGIPKKDALELSLKQAVELGFRRIYLVRSDYSQTRLPEAERLQNLLISALEQSNSAFLPEIFTTDWKDISYTEYQQVLLLDSQTEKCSLKTDGSGSRLLIVGPEGGFSPEETEFLHHIPSVSILNLPTPILRTPTAVAAGAGIILGTLLD